MFLENFLLFFQFLIQNWKHVKFSTNSVFLVKRPGTGRIGLVYRFQPLALGVLIWNSNLSGFHRFPAEPEHTAGSVGPVRIKNPAASCLFLTIVFAPYSIFAATIQEKQRSSLRKTAILHARESLTWEGSMDSATAAGRTHGLWRHAGMKADSCCDWWLVTEHDDTYVLIDKLQYERPFFEKKHCCFEMYKCIYTKIKKTGKLQVVFPSILTRRIQFTEMIGCTTYPDWKQ
jgi:hypothetical protein